MTTGSGWGRKTLLLLTAAALMYVSYGFGRWFKEWRQAPPPVAAMSTAPVQFAPLGAALPLDGPWTFAGLNWNLRSSTVGAKVVDERLASLPTATNAVASCQHASQDLLELISALSLQPTHRDGAEIYALDRPELKARLVLRSVGGVQKIISFGAGVPQSNKFWKFFELGPRDSMTTATSESPHLLPLPATALRRGGRYTNDGRLLLELVSLNSDAPTLLTLWRAAGWEVRPSGLADAGGFSYLAARGNEVIYAWTSNPNDAIGNLMLVRSPTDAEMAAGAVPASN
jgi:hypothetical protein